MHDQRNGVTNHHLYNLAWGPKTRAISWPMCHVNGYKFQTVEWGRGKKTNNTRVCVRGDTGDGESDWHRVVNEILELEYPVKSVKRVVLFACEWYNLIRPEGTRKHNNY